MGGIGVAEDRFIGVLRQEDVVVFVGAHPDDETLVAPLLAYCADHCRELVVVSLTKGESGWNLATEDLTQTLGQVRAREFDLAVRKLGGTPVTLDYVNGTSRAHPQGLAVLDPEETAHGRWEAPGGRHQTADAAYEEWNEQGGDPAVRLAGLFREKRATIAIALEPGKGVTNHVEHVAATRAVIAAVKACCGQGAPGIRLYYVVPSSDAPEGAERIATSDLSAAGGRDYARIAQASRAFYVSQFRFDPSGEQGGERRTQQCLLQETSGACRRAVEEEHGH
jgi:LmbE family N-acetylglucosaminyl deacetylase